MHTLRNSTKSLLTKINSVKSPTQFSSIVNDINNAYSNDLLSAEQTQQLIYIINSQYNNFN